MEENYFHPRPTFCEEGVFSQNWRQNGGEIGLKMGNCQTEP